MPIEWSEKIITGIPEIDAQHKALIKAFNELEQAIGQGVSEKDIREILMFLKFYAEWHFCKEEECFYREGCSLAEKNKEAHKSFVIMFEELWGEYKNGGGELGLAKKIHQSLSEWITNHIMGVDKACSVEVKQRRRIGDGGGGSP